jgi:hypothetical protein
MTNSVVVGRLCRNAAGAEAETPKIRRGVRFRPGLCGRGGSTFVKLRDVALFFLPRPSPRPEAGFQAEAGGGPAGPGLVAEGPAALDGVADAAPVGRRERFVDPAQPGGVAERGRAASQQGAPRIRSGRAGSTMAAAMGVGRRRPLHPTPETAARPFPRFKA